jgi:hypothetical protein
MIDDGLKETQYYKTCKATGVALIENDISLQYCQTTEEEF